MIFDSLTMMQSSLSLLLLTGAIFSISALYLTLFHRCATFSATSDLFLLVPFKFVSRDINNRLKTHYHHSCLGSPFLCIIFLFISPLLNYHFRSFVRPPKIHQKGSIPTLTKNAETRCSLHLKQAAATGEVCKVVVIIKGHILKDCSIFFFIIFPLIYPLFINCSSKYNGLQ